MQASALNETRLPRQIREQSDRLKQQYGGPVSGKDEPDTSAPTPPAPAPGAPVAATPADPAALTPPAEVDPRENDPTYWRHRFDVTQGVLRKARTDHQVAVNALQSQVAELTEQLRTTQAATAPAPTVDLLAYYTQEQIDDIGEDQARANIELITKTVRTQVSAALQQEVKPLKDAQANAKKAAVDARNAAFTEALVELVPNVMEIDESPEWLAWLAERNDDGILRQNVIDEHLRNYDAPRVAAMVKSFQKTQQRPTPPVTPNGTGAAPTQMPKQGDVLTAPTGPEMKEHYKQRSLGKLSKEQMERFDKRLKLLTEG